MSKSKTGSGGLYKETGRLLGTLELSRESRFPAAPTTTQVPALLPLLCRQGRAGS